MVFDFLDSIISGVEDVAKAVSPVFPLVKGAADIFGGDQKRVNVPVQTTGFKSLLGLSPELDDFIQNEVIKQVIQAGTMERPAIPMRRLTASEMDTSNIFNNPALIALQQYKDMKAQPVAAPAPLPTAETPAQPAINTAPGYDEATQTYTTPFGAMIRGDAAKKAAEDQFMKGRAESLLRERFGDSGATAKGGKLYNAQVAMPVGGVTVRGDTYDNPFTGQTYDRSKALEAILSGDLDAFRQQGATASYDPTPGLLSKVGAIAKPFLVASILGPGAAGALGAAGAGPAAAKLGSRVLAGGFNRVVA